MLEELLAIIVALDNAAYQVETGSMWIEFKKVNRNKSKELVRKDLLLRDAEGDVTPMC